MRRCKVVMWAVFLLAAAWSPIQLIAQFEQPVKDELQMTADAKAPGAGAVYLYREDVTDQGARSRTFYVRIKVLTEKGKELATVQMPYDPVSDKVDIQGRTIHADGTIVPLVDKPADLVDFKTKGFQIDTLTFTLPSVEVGSILEYRITSRYRDFPDEPTWMIQQDYFVRKAHYVYKTFGAPPAFASMLANGAKVTNDPKGTYTLDMTDIPALPDDDWMPPLNTVKWRVRFFRLFYTSTQAFWDQAGKNWVEFVHEFTKTTGTLKNGAAGMIAPADTETQKAQKIYAAVMKLENTDFTREKSLAERKKEKIKDIHNAQDVWKEQSGSSDELTLLFVALCRAAGLNVDPMKVVNRHRAIFDSSFLSSRQFDDYIAVGQLDGKEVYLDPGEKMCPFGMLHWSHMLTSGFRPSASGATIVRTPSGDYRSSSVERVADLTVDESGNVNGLVRVILSGQDALRWRQRTIEGDEDEVRKQFNEWMNDSLPEGVHGDFDHFLGLAEYDTNLLGIVHVSGILGTATGKRMFLPGLFFQAKAKHPFVAQERRTVSVDIRYANLESDDVTYRFPAAYKVDSSPQASKIAWQERANLAISTRLDGNDVNVTRRLASNFIFVDPKDYANLHDFYLKLAVADQQQLVLVRVPSASKN
jgi:hypothetical protein